MATLQDLLNRVTMARTQNVSQPIRPSMPQPTQFANKVMQKAFQAKAGVQRSIGTMASNMQTGAGNVRSAVQSWQQKPSNQVFNKVFNTPVKTPSYALQNRPMSTRSVTDSGEPVRIVEPLLQYVPMLNIDPRDSPLMALGRQFSMANPSTYISQFQKVVKPATIKPVADTLLEVKPITQTKNVKIKPLIISKTKTIPTQEQVTSTIPAKLDNFMKKSAGYSITPLVGGEKQANVYTKTLRKIQGGVSSKVEQGLGSKNSIVRNAAATLHDFFRGLGMSPERAAASSQLKGGMSVANQRGYDVQKAISNIIDNAPASKERINAVLDPEISNLKITYKDLTPAEKEAHDLIREGLDVVHDISYANGWINKKVYSKNLGKYTPRMYAEMEIPDEVNPFVSKATKKIDTTISKAREEVTQWKKDNSLNDPIYALSKRMAQVQNNYAIKRYTDFLASKPNLVSDIERPGFTKLADSPAYGNLSGKWVLNSAAEELKGYFFSSKMADTAYDLFKMYDRLTPRQLQKKLLTVFNPTTNIGNITTDNVFGFMVGVDPLTLNTNIVKLKANPSEYKQVSDYLMRKGIIGTDITRADFTTGLSKIDELAQGKSKNILIKAADKIQDFYGGTDDIYKAAAFKSLVDRGVSVEEATRLVADGFQNYASVGKFYDFYAKTPIVGQAFIKFQGDLMRIIKNAAINRPIHLISFLGMLYGMSRLASKASGESEEDRIARETRFGAPYIPGLNIPLTWQTPMGEINVARYISPYFSNNVDKGQESTAMLKKTLPFMPDIVTNENGSVDVPSTVAKTATDPLLAPLVQLAVDRDFRGKPITDEKASPFFGSDLTKEEQTQNKLKWIGRQYLPPTVNSAIDVNAAAQGKEDRYGKTRTVPQALARLGGIKVETFGKKEIKKSQENNAYFEARNPAFAKLDAAAKAAVLSIPKQDPDDEQARMTKYNTLLQNRQVYEYFKEIAYNKVNGDTSKIDPLYTYPYPDVRKYMRYQSLPVASKDKKDMYKAYPVIGEIGKARSEYFTANPIDAEQSRSTKPQASAEIQAAMDRKEWSYPGVSEYLDATRLWQNEQRMKLDLLPIEDGYSSSGYRKYGSYIKKPKKVTFKKISPKLTNIKITLPKPKKLKKLKIKKIPTFKKDKVRNIIIK